MAWRLGIALVLAVVAALVALFVDRRQRAAHQPFTSDADGLRQLQRSDFPRPDAPWLVVLFSSTDCDGCSAMATKIAALESDEVAVVECEYHADTALHRRYEIDAVPLVAVASADGVVRAQFLGSASATDIWAAVAALRGG